MFRQICSFCVLLATSAGGFLYADTLAEDIKNSAAIIREFESIPETSIPASVLKDARGLAIITVYKAGFGISGRIGDGILIAKTDKGWSAPSAIGMGGAGVGPQIGLQATDFVFILNTKEAVDAFANQANLSLGADVSVAAGPVGRTAEGGVLTKAAVYSYSKSQGLFIGASLEGTVLAARNDANADFYGKPVTTRELLSGKVPPPAQAKVLYQELDKYK